MHELSDADRAELSFISNNFEPICIIGDGTFSIVYKAEDRRVDAPQKYVAIKKITQTTHPNRIASELSILRTLAGTQNVVQLLYVGRNLDQVVAVFPLFEHSDFKAFLETCCIHDIRSYIHSLLVAVAGVHAKGIIHRDIKPANFLYSKESRKGVLVDFGLAERERGSRSDSNLADRLTDKLVHNFDNTTLSYFNFQKQKNNSDLDISDPKKVHDQNLCESSNRNLTDSSHLTYVKNTEKDFAYSSDKINNKVHNLDHVGIIIKDKYRAKQIHPNENINSKSIQDFNMHIDPNSETNILRDSNTRQATTYTVQNEEELELLFGQLPQNRELCSVKMDILSKFSSIKNQYSDAIIKQNIEVIADQSYSLPVMKNTPQNCYRESILPCSNDPTSSKTSNKSSETSRSTSLNESNWKIYQATTFQKRETKNISFKSTKESQFLEQKSNKNIHSNLESVKHFDLIDDHAQPNLFFSKNKNNTVQNQTTPLKFSLQYGSAIGKDTILTKPSAFNRTNIVRNSGPPGYYKHDTRPPMKAPRAGTRGFRAPEVLFKSKKQTTKIDIWGVGVIMLILLTKRYPFFMAQEDIDALVEIATIFGTIEMKKTARHFGRIWRSNIDTIPVEQIPFETIISSLNKSSDACPEAVDLLYMLLELTPEKRITAECALKHPFFKNI